MACDCGTPLNVNGNSVLAETHIPLKQGFPLSSLNERAYVIGSIPQVVRHPAFTLVDGGVVANLQSNAGIMNMASFFKPRKGLYKDTNMRLSENCCA